MQHFTAAAMPRWTQMSKLTLSSWKLAFNDAFLGAASTLPACIGVICEPVHAAAADCRPSSHLF